MAHPSIPLHIEQGIIADRTVGIMPVKEIAEKHGVSTRTVNRVWCRFRDTVEKTTGLDSREEMHRRFRRKATVAVEAGLDSKKNPYARGNLGVKVLEGTGDLKTNEVVINNFNLVQQTPAHLRERYLGIEEEHEP